MCWQTSMPCARSMAEAAESSVEVASRVAVLFDVAAEVGIRGIEMRSPGASFAVRCRFSKLGGQLRWPVS